MKGFEFVIPANVDNIPNTPCAFTCRKSSSYASFDDEHGRHRYVELSRREKMNKAGHGCKITLIDRFFREEERIKSKCVWVQDHEGCVVGPVAIDSPIFVASLANIPERRPEMIPAGHLALTRWGVMRNFGRGHVVDFSTRVRSNHVEHVLNIGNYVNLMLNFEGDDVLTFVDSTIAHKKHHRDIGDIYVLPRIRSGVGGIVRDVGRLCDLSIACFPSERGSMVLHDGVLYGKCEQGYAPVSTPWTAGDGVINMGKSYRINTRRAKSLEDMAGLGVTHALKLVEDARC